jgi:hypothetical protein
MAARSFPALGFDPAPGDLSVIENLIDKLTKTTNALGDGKNIIGKLSSSSSEVWQGDAATAFRNQLTSDLPNALSNAHDSLSKALTALTGWHGNLASYQQTANQLEAQADGEKKDFDARNAAYTSAQGNPDLKLAGQTFSTQAEANAAQARLNNATSQLQTVQQALQNAHDTLAGTIRRAQELQTTHGDNAHTVAGQLKHAPDHLAPHKPGLFSSIMNWIGGHLKQIGDILSAVSAISGLLALILPPPADAICLAVSIVASIGALAAHLGSGDHNLLDLAGDVAGIIPGVGLLGDAAKGAQLTGDVAKGLDAVKQADSLGQVASGLGDMAKGAGENISRFGSKMVDVTKEGASMAKTEGSAISTVISNGVTHVPGLSSMVSDTSKLAVNIDRTIASVGAASGTLSAVGDYTNLGTAGNVNTVVNGSSGVFGVVNGTTGLVTHGLDLARGV